jgi:DNA polymerase-3 subunit delta'
MNVWNKLDRSRVVDGLARQMKSGDVPHAWLLLGPSGSGKRFAALAMAAALNCEGEPGVGCGTCSACARIMRKAYPDVHHIAPEGPLIPVDVIREIVIPEAARSPFEGHRKVFIIDEADRMNDAAQNAILKTLEEPQPDTIFILVSDNEGELLETIWSRCRIVRFEPVSEARIVELLRDDDATQETALLAARLSEGDFERARQLVEDSALLERRRMWIGIAGRLQSSIDALDAAAEVIAAAKEAVKEREGLQKIEITQLAEAMGEGRGTAHVRNALAKRHKRELRRLEENVLGEALATLGSFYRDVLALRSGAVEGIVNLDLVEALRPWAENDAVSDGALVRAVDRCLETRATFQSNPNAPLQIEATLLDLARLVPPPVTTDAWA